MSESHNVELLHRFPDVDDYRRLRKLAGLSEKSPEAAVKGLVNTLYGVTLIQDSELIGMGRIIGDGGCFFVVVDIAVHPDFQRLGLGKRIMQALDAWLRANAPVSAHVSLLADGDARHLYAQYGFIETAPASIGMGYSVKP